MTWVALLYSIVLPAGARLKMADLKALAESLGYRNVRTVASSGNLIFDTDARDAAAIEADLESAFAKRFGKAVPVILRDAKTFRERAHANPFPDVDDPRQVSVRVMRKPYPASVSDDLKPYVDDERVALVDGDLFIHFPGQPSRTRLLAAFGTKRFASPGTFRTLAMLRKIAAAL
ncbi:DUF1697 domain-containing protein [Asticcacaulis solisilvae]|uniref:DUF1697 domain-containing protein n=1 Tax=Asticcacaulis solisilvae TaxID=1217274 RepID=UPI003FD8B381